MRGQVLACGPYALAAFFAFLRRCQLHCENNDASAAANDDNHNDAPPLSIGGIHELPKWCRLAISRVKNKFNSNDPKYVVLVGCRSAVE